ncbi:MAG: hypothetical protein V4654_08415 [Bdellovibrionota bacterium]
MVKLNMRNTINLTLLIFFFGQIVNAQDAKTNLPINELSTYVAKLEKADAYEVRKFFIKKDPSFKNGLILLNISYNCGLGLCTNYVFAKNPAGKFDFVGTIEGIFEESKTSTATPDFPDIWTQTKSARESVVIKWSYNTKKQVYEIK